MRFKIKTLLMAAVAVCALSGVAVASASAHEFIASKAGTLKGTGGRQGFQIPEGSGECGSTTIAGGKAKSGSQADLVEDVTYNECGVGYNWKFTPAEYEVGAAGTLKLLNTVTFSNAVAKCHWTIAPQTVAEPHLSFADSGSELKEGAELSLLAEGSGGLCGKVGTQQKIYLGGNLTVGLEGGTLQYK
jgi:opacity protein-like surface antigen